MSRQEPAGGRAVALLTAGLAVLVLGVFMLGGQLIPDPVRAAPPEAATPGPTTPGPATGRRRQDDVTYSLAGECVRLRGAPETNDVSISVCWAAYVQDLGAVRPEVRQMIATAARSI
ncbi:hypothetical protein ACWF0M_13495 [Kribbella sp. NPDC055110]